MNTDKLLHAELTYNIRGAIFSVYNVLGFGHKELVYHKALAIEFRKQGLKFQDEIPIPVYYEKEKVGTYKPDFVVEDKVLIEIKALPFITRESEVQLVYYLKGTSYNLGLLVNFGSKKLEIRRKVWG